MQCANLSFASDRFLFISGRVASFHLGAGNRLLLPDKFNLNVQYCMLGISAYLIRAVEILMCHLPDHPLWDFRIVSSFPIQPFILKSNSRPCASGLSR